MKNVRQQKGQEELEQRGYYHPGMAHRQIRQEPRRLRNHFSWFRKRLIGGLWRSSSPERTTNSQCSSGWVWGMHGSRPKSANGSLPKKCTLNKSFKGWAISPGSRLASSCTILRGSASGYTGRRSTVANGGLVTSILTLKRGHGNLPKTSFFWRNFSA